MALRQIVLQSRIAKAQARKDALEETRKKLQERRKALTTREEELTQAVQEVTEETSEEDRAAVDAQVEAWEKDDEALKKEEAQNDTDLQQEADAIEEMEKELEEINARGTAKPKAPEQKPEERKERTSMNNYNTRSLWFGMDHQERDAFMAREDVKGFVCRVREMIGEKRSFTGADLTIPHVMLPMIRQRVAEASKLYKHVNVQRISGDSEITIMGAIPAAVWTQMCAKINELEFTAGQVTLNGYKVAGFVPLCNAVKEDSDVDLVTLILNLLTQSLGLALDMAILYGTGTKMPMGIVTRLAKTAAPDDYHATAPAWKDLSGTNLLAVTGKTGAQLFQAIIEATGAIDSDYTNGSMFWAMNAKTHTKVVAQSVSINAAGAVVAGVDRTMPIMGGAIEVLNFIPDDVIIAGYGDMYILVERAGMELAYDTSVRFLEDETVFRGKARYDGTPVIPAAFVAIGINGTKPEAGVVTFAEEKANQA